MSCVTRSINSPSTSKDLLSKIASKISPNRVSTYKILLCYHNEFIYECTIPHLMVLLVVTRIARAFVGQQWCCQPAPWVGLLKFVPLSAPRAVKQLLRISWQLDVSHDKFCKCLCSYNMRSILCYTKFSRFLEYRLVIESIIHENKSR